jgi:hypothetical protein
MKPEFFRRILEKYQNIKFHENQSSGSQGVPCGRRDGDMADMKLTVVLQGVPCGRRDGDMADMQLTVVLRSFTNSAENHFVFIAETKRSVLYRKVMAVYS